MAQADAEKPKVTVDGKEYLLNDLSEKAKSQVNNLRYVDAEISNLQGKLAIFQTARQVYLSELKKQLPE